MKRWFTEHKGLTLVEMMVVLAILAVLAAVIVPAVTGTTSKSRATTQAEDLNQTQNALDHFNTEDIDGSPYPTLVPLSGGGSAWTAGGVPVSRTVTAEAVGTGDGSNKVFYLKDPPIVALSDEIKVDTVTKTRVTDYAINNSTGVITFVGAPLATEAVAASYTATASPSGAGTSGDPYVFTQGDLAGLGWTSEATTSDGTKHYYYPDYIKTKPRHDAETVSVTAGATSDSIAIQKGASVIYVKLKNLHTDTVLFPAWAVDNTGVVWVFISKDAY